MFASENAALKVCGFELVRDLNAGEAVLVTETGELFTSLCSETAKLVPCIFEQVYLARPDSILDAVSVYRSRIGFGASLARKLMKYFPEHGIDSVIPIPESSTSAAMEMARELGIPYREGFIKNRYVGRTFIMPNQQLRRVSIRRKLSPLNIEFSGKTVLLVDDSIVRGTTSREVVRMAREAGARRVLFASAAPPVRYPNIYGIDMPTHDELIAHNLSEEGICQAIGADGLVYQDIDDMVKVCHDQNREISAFECSVFTGEYIVGDINAAYLASLARQRGDSAFLQPELEMTGPGG